MWQKPEVIPSERYTQTHPTDECWFAIHRIMRIVSVQNPFKLLSVKMWWWLPSLVMSACSRSHRQLTSMREHGVNASERCPIRSNG